MSNALVFGGGGGKGAYEVGVWKAIKECGLESCFQSVVGTSVGALNAMLFAQGSHSNAERIWNQISNDTMLELSDTMDSLISQNGLKNIIEANATGNLKISTYVCCTRVEKDFIGIDEALFPEYFRLNSHSRQEQIQLLLASSVLPGAFPVVEFRGKRYRDGGIDPNHNLPIEFAINQLRHQKVLAISLQNGPSGWRTINGSRVFILRPTSSLGEFMNGTVDFDARNARWRMKLGYYDFMQYKNQIMYEIKEHKQSIKMTKYAKKRFQKMF